MRTAATRSPLEDILQLLVDADPHGPKGRFVVLFYRDSGEPTEATSDADQGHSPLQMLCSGTTLLEALDQMGEEIYTWLADQDLSAILPAPEEPLRWFDEATDDYLDITKYYQKLQTLPRRLVFSLFYGSLAGPFYVVDPSRAAQDVYVGDSASLFPKSRFVFGMGASAPNQEQAFCILELQPKGTWTQAERALHDACKESDLSALQASLAAGARIDALDDEGRTALHVAVSARSPAAVLALLKAGADPNSQASFGNAPLFAGAAKADDSEYWACANHLQEAGADINARNEFGETLIDQLLAQLSAHPSAGTSYPAEAIRLVQSWGGKSNLLEGVPIGQIVSFLPWGDMDALRRRTHQLRYLLEAGVDANDPRGSSLGVPPLQSLIGTTGYSPAEIPGPVLEEMVQLLLSHGAKEGPGFIGKTALQQAQTWKKHGFHNYDGVIRLLSAVQKTVDG